MSLALANEEKVAWEVGIFIKHGKKKKEMERVLDAFYSASGVTPNLKGALHLVSLSSNSSIAVSLPLQPI